MIKINCSHQLDYWEEECPHCDGLKKCRVKSTNDRIDIFNAIIKKYKGE